MTETESHVDLDQHDPRALTPDTVGGWMATAEQRDAVFMLEAADQTVFVARIETDEFERGYKWTANTIDLESGARTTSFCTSESLVERWFQEAVPGGRVWELDWDEAPMERDSR